MSYENTNTRKVPGPKRKFGPREEIHLKFSSDILQYIREKAGGYQVYFDELVKQDMERSKSNK